MIIIDDRDCSIVAWISRKTIRDNEIALRNFLTSKMQPRCRSISLPAGGIPNFYAVFTISVSSTYKFVPNLGGMSGCSNKENALVWTQ